MLTTKRDDQIGIHCVWVVYYEFFFSNDMGNADSTTLGMYDHIFAMTPIFY